MPPRRGAAPFAFTPSTNLRSLLVIPAIRFANVPRWIDDLAFVPLGTDHGDCDELIVRMSHGSSTAVAGLVAPHLTEPQVEVLRVRSHRFTRIANTWLRLGLQRPFLYIPARGNLVIDVIALGARPDPRGLGYRGFAKVAPDVGWAAMGTDTPLIPDRGAATPFPKLALCSAAAGLDGSARLRDTVEIWLSNTAASTGSFLMRGLDSVGSTAWARQRGLENGAPFPMDLSSAGMNGCRVDLAPLDASPRATNAAGIALASFGGPARRLPPADPTQTSGVPVDNAQVAKTSLALLWSQASTSTSTGPGSSAGQLSGCTKTSTALTAHPGWMSATRSARACVLAWPSVRPSACTWRLMFDSATWSRSNSTRPATPLRASASTVHEPTPPSPTTPMRAARMRA